MDIELNFTDAPDITEDFGISPGEGGVISVNEKTGRVVLTAKDVGAQETLVSGVNIKTINGNSLIGSGNINITGGDKAQVYRGATEPTGENILIWIDTSESPTPTDNTLITSDGKTFITSDNKTFITA